MGGIVPETFRIVRTLLDRVDNSITGQCSDEFQVKIPEWAHGEAEFMASLSGPEMHTKYDYHDGLECMS